MTDIDVLVLGGAGVDTIVYVPQLPMPYADSHLVEGITTRAGQTGDGVAAGVHALGLRTHHLDVIGDDPEGALVRAMHLARGIPFTAVDSAAGTKRAVNLVDPDGRRMSFYDPRTGSEPLPPGTVAELATRSRHVHVCITAAVPAVDGPTLSTDLHNWDGIEPYHEQFAFAADVVFLSAAALADPVATVRKILDRGRARVAVATAGAIGSFVLSREDPTVQHIEPAPLPAAVVDSNGAGDAYASAFLYGWLAGEEPLRCARFGAIAGAHACTVPATAVDPIDATTLRARLAAWERG